MLGRIFGDIGVAGSFLTIYLKQKGKLYIIGREVEKGGEGKDMVKIDLLCVGKIKEAYLKAGIDEYKKRLSRYCRLEILEVADERTPEEASAAEEDQIRKREGERLLRLLKTDAYVIALAIEGRQFDSVGLARELERIPLSGTSQIQFVIGGSLGLHPDILKRADLLLSFSKLTFPHQLMRLLFLEQLYRTYRIQKNEPYHK